MTIKPWRDALKIHPAAELLPALSPDELKALGEDIKKNGLTRPIALWRAHHNGEALLLDGRNRLDAIEIATGSPVEVGPPSIMAGKDFLACDKVIVLDKSVEPFAYVISANIHRRHLSAEQKRELIAKLLKATPDKSDRQIGKQIKADNKTVAAVRSDLERREEIPHVKVRTDAKGRNQPARKQRKTAKPKRNTSRDQRELEKAQAHIAELEAAREQDKDLAERLRVAEIKIVGLESEIIELRGENAALRQKLEAAVPHVVAAS